MSLTQTNAPSVTQGQSSSSPRRADPDAAAAVQGLIDRIVTVLQPEEIWLFGSRARDEGSPTSDWDFMVILPDDAPEALLDGGRVWELCLRDALVPADIVPVCRREFEQFRSVAGSLCRTVAEEGRPVYAR